MFKYTAAVTYTNDIGSLETTLKGVKPLWEHLVVVDNSLTGSFINHPLAQNVRVVRPPVTLSCSQSFNYMQNLARADNSDVLIMMHSDGVITQESIEALMAKVDQLVSANAKWGAVFTFYDVFCAFNMDAVNVIGPWDQVMGQYPIDKDYYLRLGLSGFQIHELGSHGIKHLISSTIKRDMFYSFTNDIANPFYHHYKDIKWQNTKSIFPFGGHDWKQFIKTVTGTEVFHNMTKVVNTNEGSLLLNDEQNCIAQLAFITNLVKAIKPKKILETGTNRGYFAYTMQYFLESFELFTYDNNPQSGTALKFLGTNPNIPIHFTCGDTLTTLSSLNEPNIDFAWIDGGHVGEVPASDIRNAMRLEIPHILIDDGEMKDVTDAANSCLQERPDYIRAHHPYPKEDRRGIIYLRKKRG